MTKVLELRRTSPLLFPGSGPCVTRDASRGVPSFQTRPRAGQSVQTSRIDRDLAFIMTTIGRAVDETLERILGFRGIHPVKVEVSLDRELTLLEPS